MGEGIGVGFLTVVVIFFLAMIATPVVGGGIELLVFGIALLCGVMVGCSYVIVKSINALRGENKEETKEKEI